MSSIDALLASALERRRALGLPSTDTNAYRLVHGAGDGLEGLTVDVYDRWLVASLYTDERTSREEGWLDALHRLGFAGVYVKQRPRQANELDPRERLERCPPEAVRGESAPAAFVVRESGMPFEVRLGDGLSTGLFLDQRDNRVRLRDVSRGRSVLNLFSYTCAFGVAAALGGAMRTVNIDVAKAALERGKHNYELAGIDLAAHQFLARDVLDTLPRMVRKGERFDLVVLDPPSYASTKKGRFSVERDYTELAALALSLLVDGGTLLACTNHQRSSEGDLERAIVSASAGLSRKVRRLELAPPPRDHPVRPGAVPHLKTAWVTA